MSGSASGDWLLARHGEGTNRNKLNDELGWETHAHRRWARRRFHLFKVISTKSPADLYEIAPSRRIPIYGSGMAQTFHEMRCNKNKYRDSFFPNSIKAWNNLTDDFRAYTSISIFKNMITSSLIRPPKKSTFDIHDPLVSKRYFNSDCD